MLSWWEHRVIYRLVYHVCTSGHFLYTPTIHSGIGSSSHDDDIHTIGCHLHIRPTCYACCIDRNCRSIATIYFHLYPRLRFDFHSSFWTSVFHIDRNGSCGTISSTSLHSNFLSARWEKNYTDTCKTQKGSSIHKEKVRKITCESYEKGYEFQIFLVQKVYFP